MDHQDFSDIVIGKNKKPSVAQATREGTVIPVKKTNVDRHLQKVDREELNKLASVPRDISIVVQQARVEKKLTQKELATKLNVKQSQINDIESGKAVLDKQLLVKMQRILGVKLTGKCIGEKL